MRVNSALSGDSRPPNTAVSGMSKIGGDEETAVLGVTIYNNLRKAYLALENGWRYYIGWKQHFVTHQTKLYKLEQQLQLQSIELQRQLSDYAINLLISKHLCAMSFKQFEFVITDKTEVEVSLVVREFQLRTWKKKTNISFSSQIILVLPAKVV